MRVAVISVPHCGTQFTSRLLLSHPEIRIRGGLDQKIDCDLLQGHFGFHDHLLEEVFKRVPVIAPIRDPLLSIISSKKRKQPIDLRPWNSLIRFHEWNNYFPVDLLFPDERLPKVMAILNKIGLEMTDEVVDYVMKWEKKNTAGATDLDLAYESKDRDYLFERVPEIKYLEFMKPILKEIGYNLLW